MAYRLKDNMDMFSAACMIAILIGRGLIALHPFLPAKDKTVAMAVAAALALISRIISAVPLCRMIPSKDLKTRKHIA